MKAALLWAVVLTLMGCSTVPPVPTSIEVQVPVAVACLRADQVPTLPALTPNAELAALNNYHLALRLAAERSALAAYAVKAQPLLEACSRQ